MDGFRTAVTRGYELLERIKREYWGASRLGLAPPSRQKAVQILIGAQSQLDTWRASIEALLTPDDLIRLRNCPARPHSNEWPKGDPVCQVCNHLLDQLEWLDKFASRPASDGKRERQQARERRGPKPIHNASEDAKLLQDWQAAKRSGSTQKQFCREKGINHKELISAQGRQRERSRRAARKQKTKRSNSRVKSR